jgi:hypothetical protein
MDLSDSRLKSGGMNSVMSELDFNALVSTIMTGYFLLDGECKSDTAANLTP